MGEARVLVVGLDPNKLVGWDPAPVAAAIARGRERFNELGLVADYCLVGLDDDPLRTIEDALRAAPRDCVVVGGGLRHDDDLVELLEQVIDLVRTLAPEAAIAFNRSPEDCADAALRRL